MKRIAFLLRPMQTSLFLFVNAVPAQEQIDTSNKIEHSLLERMFGYDVAYEDFEQRQSLDNVNVLKRLPIIKHDMSEEIRQTIISSAKERMKKEKSNDYENTLACEYVFHFCDTTAAALQQILNVFLYKITEKQKKYTVILRTVNGS